jgi:hypothetical protein
MTILITTQQQHRHSRATGIPAKRTPRQATPHLCHPLNNIGDEGNKASVSTLIIGTLQVLGIYDTV